MKSLLVALTTLLTLALSADAKEPHADAVEALLKTMDDDAAELRDVSVEWIVSGRYVDTGDTANLIRVVQRHVGNRVHSAAWNLPRGSWPEKLEDVRAWRALGTVFRELPSYAIGDGKRYYNYLPDRRFEAGYWGVYDIGAQIDCAKRPWLGTYLAENTHKPLGAHLREKPVHRVATKWGQVALVAARAPTWTVVYLLDPTHRSVPVEWFFTRAGLDPVVRAVSEAKDAAALRAYPEILSHRRVLAWMQAEGLPITPRTLWKKYYGTRSKEPTPVAMKKRDMEWVLTVTSLRRSDEPLGNEQVPQKLRHLTLKIVDKQRGALLRRHPDGRIEEVRKTRR